MLFSELDLVAEAAPAAAARNMAVDEALGRRAVRPVLRVYRWSEPSVSCGYFEKIAALRSQYPEHRLVRRWTGGGAVVHGRDFTYALAIPRAHPLAAAGAAAAYAAVHGAVRSFLRSLGWPVELASCCSTGGLGCFQRPVISDLLLDGRKIAGAAQRRTREFLLHQGSVQQVPNENWPPDEFAAFFCKSFRPRGLSCAEEADAQLLERTRYGQPGWTNLR